MEKIRDKNENTLSKKYALSVQVLQKERYIAKCPYNWADNVFVIYVCKVNEKGEYSNIDPEKRNILEAELSQTTCKNMSKLLNGSISGFVLHNNALGEATCCLSCFLDGFIYRGDQPIAVIQHGPVICQRGCGDDQKTCNQ